MAGITEDAGQGEVGLSDNGLRVLKARYLKKDEHGQCTESPASLFRRVAGAVAEAELAFDRDPANRSEWEDRFYSLMTSGRFLPNSPTLMNAGREMGMLSACFVLPVGDSINEIFDAIKNTALIQKAGGGTGFAFDQLRPTGDYISSSGGTTSGPISFWRAFSEATNAIQQGAFRRGANMGMMNIDHPDILKFLYAKQDLTQFTNYNISVKVGNQWMADLQADRDGPHVVRNPRNGDRFWLPKDIDIWAYDIRSLIPLDPSGSDPASDRPVYSRGDIWNIIIRHAWQTGEPGVVFIDKINEANPTPHVGRIEATNPCGEQPLLPYEACNLGSIDLNRFVRHGGSPEAEVDWPALGQTIQEAVRFLDDVVEINRYPLPEIEDICRANRKIGLGIMGFADALYSLGVAYDSEEGIAWGERFMKFLNCQAHQESEQLAETRGCFPNWKGSIWDLEHHRPMRNACCTTVAPTGTISIIAGCSCGIEPLFGLVFYRNVLKGQDQGRPPMVEANPIFERAIQGHGMLSEGLMDRIAKDGTLANTPDIPEEMRRVFVCASDISPEWHVRMQAAFQAHCDSSISKTINFPTQACVEDVATIYEMSYRMGCKGVTVYRDGCRQDQPMVRTPQSSPAAAVVEGARVTPLNPVELGEICTAIRIRQMTPFGNMHVQITVDPHTERELEVFAQLGKGGDLANSDLEAICRMISLWLRAGGDLQHVIHQLKGIGSSLQVSTKEGKIMSLGDGLARALQKYERGKSRLGLRTLILGEFDPAELDKDVANPPRQSGSR
ncbi:MAG: adenosylcobalamin-dependent ribonucleoside-diphosphate reductase, partial [Planctomycetes bacterium]|nr:adenosylcobalamin-dependent ribonucleoside-diphosphate reductase [Planctomycetota bacterium]